jgi:DNA ligase D-like protein (predicted 3'-phosphoesterase)
MTEEKPVRCDPVEPWDEVPPELVDIFVIQRHDASTLHWDLRLSMDGVLKSWAVPKEPPTTKGPRRLAIMVDDHDLSYHDFEGVIEEGHYGAGKVEMWDRGKYELLDRKETKIVFNLDGDRLKGKYVLLEFKKAGENAWLFFRAE